MDAATAPSSLKHHGISSVKGDKFLSAALKRAFPMYVLPVQTLLSPSFQRIRSHEELRDSGTLVEWRPGMAPVLFVSHTWLRFRHPDSEAGDKFKALVGMLRRIVSGNLEVQPNWLTHFMFGSLAKKLRISATALRRDLTDGYVFFE